MNPQLFSPAALALGLLVGLGQCDTAVAQQGVHPGVADGMKRLAGSVAEFFEQEEHDKVVIVGSFVHPDGEGSELLRRLLTEHLKRQRFQLRKSKFAVNGRFIKQFRKADTQDRFNSVAMKVTAEIRDRTNDELVQKISIPIFGDGAAQLLGPSASLPTDRDEAERQSRLNDAIDSPDAVVVGSESRSTATSPFGVEIRVRRGKGDRTTARRPVRQDGQPFVKLSRGEEYVVRLTNRAKFEVAVTLTIDGLSMFAFSKEGNFGSQVIVSAGQSVDIPGWYITRDDTDAFEITSYSKSAAASKGLSGGVGVITASFAAAWDPAAKPPADEAGAKGPDAATGKGRRIAQKYESVRRVTGRVRSLVSIRYAR